MDQRELLDCIFLQSWNTSQRSSAILLGQNKAGQKKDVTITLKMHQNIYKYLQQLAEAACLPVEEFLVDCAAHGMVGLGILFGTVECQVKREYEDLHKEGRVVEH